MGYGELATVANSFPHFQPRGVLREGPCRGEYLMEPVVEMWEMETWLTAFSISSLEACSG